MSKQDRDLSSSPAIIRMRRVLARTGLSKTSLYALVATGDFPPPLRITRRAVGWREDQVADWIMTREQTRPRPARRAQ